MEMVVREGRWVAKKVDGRQRREVVVQEGRWSSKYGDRGQERKLVAKKGDGRPRREMGG
jgi:hypothetical protein